MAPRLICGESGAVGRRVGLQTHRICPIEKAYMVGLKTHPTATRNINQYVARPPEISNTPPVSNEFSSDASQQTIDVTSSTVTNRPRGIFDSM